MIDNLMTTKEVSKQLGVTVRTIYRYIEKGAPYCDWKKTPTSNIIKLFDFDELNEWLKDSKVQKRKMITLNAEENFKRAKRTFLLTNNEHIAVRKFVQKIRKTTNEQKKNG